ncbi:MAG TPA: adenylate/guanylate cyclase domain-containing protein [Alphaproteobacteria bacterium]|nr:adenylate/guanylate cyclase domain-containing protein [Alphaproteobacteria bacterium]
MTTTTRKHRARRKAAEAPSPAAPAVKDYFRIDGEFAGVGAPIAERDISRWILTDGRKMEREADFFDQLCWRLVGQGVPLWRATLHVGTLHPEIRGFGCRWWRERNVVEKFHVAHGAETSKDYLTSPIRDTVESGRMFRRRLETGPIDFPLLAKLRGQGATDYFAAPLNISVQRRHPVVTWATDRPGGFTDADLERLEAIRPALAAVVEARSIRKIAKNLIEIYLGRDIGQRIFYGQILRGAGEKMRAVIMASDLRGFTRLSDRLSGETVIRLLDAYFEYVAAPVHAAGGEILKFVGDGVLAIFPTNGGREDDAAIKGLAVAREIITRLETHNSTCGDGTARIRAGIGLHLGDVIYGNVGAPDRLDFTAIGPAVNLACRLESLTKRFDRPVLASRAFADVCARPLVSLGFQPIRGLSEPEELFGLPEHHAEA